jgi:hypothetical protein
LHLSLKRSLINQEKLKIATKKPTKRCDERDIDTIASPLRDYVQKETTLCLFGKASRDEFSMKMSYLMGFRKYISHDL